MSASDTPSTSRCILHVQLRCQVDVRVLNDAPLGFRYHALQGRPLVTRDDELLDELRARTWDDYLDFQPFARQSSVTTSSTWNDTRRAWPGI
jgi:hypothetical protein